MYCDFQQKLGKGEEEYMENQWFTVWWHSQSVFFCWSGKLFLLTCNAFFCYIRLYVYKMYKCASRLYKYVFQHDEQW